MALLHVVVLKLEVVLKAVLSPNESRHFRMYRFETLYSVAALVQSLHSHKNLFPNEADFKGAQAALMRLQQTYDLSPATMSDGIAPGVPSTTRMSADDTFALGKAAYGNRDFQECELWMKETLRLLDKGRVQGTGPSRFDVLDFLAYCEYSVS